MIIVAGHYSVPAEGRDAYVAAHRPLMETARAAEGNAGFAITADPVDPGRVNMVEIWADRPALDAWRKRARVPRTGAKLTGVNVSLFEAGEPKPPFGKG